MLVSVTVCGLGGQEIKSLAGFLSGFGPRGAKRQYVIWWGGMALSTCKSASSKGGRE